MGKQAVTMVWAVVIQILTCINTDVELNTHPLKLGVSVIVLSLLLGFALTWNGLLLRGWVAREGSALVLEQLGLSIIYLSLVSFVALHVYHDGFAHLVVLLFVAFLVVLPFLIANFSGRGKGHLATN